MRYHDYGTKKQLLLKLAMTTLINPPRKKNVWMNPKSDNWFKMFLHRFDDHF